jgi:hypothetical protein
MTSMPTSTLWRKSLGISATPRILEGEDRRAVLAATADTQIALAAWSNLLAEADFVDIARSTQRLAPMVYLNLKNVTELPERGRLRGAYKYAWSKNHKIIASLVPVVRQLNSQRINYRIAKGVAIQLMLGLVGARVVGDVDLVVSRQDVGAVREILEEQGFRCNSFSSCGMHPPGSIHSALDFNKGDVHVDVHVAELKQPSGLMTEMLRESPHSVDFAGTIFLLPSPELLVLHSAVHGKASASETDFSQSVTDIVLLIPRCTTSVLLRQAERTDVYEDLWFLGQTLNNLGRSELLVAPRRVRYLARSAPLVAGKGSGLLRKVRYATYLWGQRFHAGGPVLSAIRGFSGRRLPYILWTLLGQFSSLERFIFARRRGFLPLPPVPLEEGGFFQPFTDLETGTVVANSVASACFDYRFVFRCPTDAREFVLTLDGKCLDAVDVTVHHNGERLLRMVAGSTERRLAVLNPAPHNEISIRPISGSCEACFGSMKALRVAVTYRRAGP